MSDQRLERAIREGVVTEQIAREFGGNLWSADGKPPIREEEATVVVSPKLDVPKQFAGMAAVMHQAGFVVVEKPEKTIVVPLSDAHPEINNDFTLGLNLAEQRELLTNPNAFYQRKIAERKSEDSDKTLIPPDLRIEEGERMAELTPSDIVRLIHAPARFLLFYFQKKHEIEGNIEELSWEEARPSKQRKILHTFFDQDLEIYERPLCLMERIWTDVHELIGQPTVFSNEDAVQSLLIGYTEILSFYRERWYKKNLEEEIDVGYRYPEIRGLHEQIINLLQSRKNSIKTRNFLYGILMYSELSDDQCEETLKIMDRFGDLRRPLALQLSAQLAKSKGKDSAWIQLQESRRNKLLAEISVSEQELYDKYQELADSVQGLVIAESWLEIKPRKVGLEIEYGDESRKTDCPGFMAGRDMGDTLELRKLDDDLIYGVDYVAQLGNLAMFFDRASPEGLHIHLDQGDHKKAPELPGIEVVVNNQTPIRSAVRVYTWEVRGLTIPRMDRFQRLDPINISNLITLYYHLSQKEHRKLLLTHPEAPLSWQQLVFGYLICETDTPEGRLAALMVLDNPISLSSFNMLEVSDMFSNVGMDEILESISNSFPESKLFEAKVVRGQLTTQLAIELSSKQFKDTDEEKDKYLWIIETFGGETAGNVLASDFVDRRVGLEVLPIIEKIGGDESASILLEVLSPSNQDSLAIAGVICKIGHIEAIKGLVSKLFNSNPFPESVQELILSFLENKIANDDKLRKKFTSTDTYTLMKLAGAYVDKMITGEARIIARRIFKIASSPSASIKLAAYLCEPTVEREEIAIFVESIGEYGDDNATAPLVENMCTGQYQNVSTVDVLTIARKVGGDRTALALLDLAEETSEVKMRLLKVDREEVLDIALTIGGPKTALLALNNLIENKHQYLSRKATILKLARKRGNSGIAKMLASNLDSLSETDEEVSRILSIISDIGNDEAAASLIKNQSDKGCSQEVLETVALIAGDESSAALIVALEKKAINPHDLENVYSIIQEHGGAKTSSRCLTAISTNVVDDKTKLRLWNIFKIVGDSRQCYYLTDLFIEGSISIVPPEEVLFFISRYGTRDSLLLLAERINDSHYSSEYLEEVINILLLNGDRLIFFVLLRKSDLIPINNELALVIFLQYLKVADYDDLYELATLFSQGLLRKIPLVLFLKLFSVDNLNGLESAPSCFARLISGISGNIFSEIETILIMNKIIELRLYRYSVISSALLGSIRERCFSDREFERVMAVVKYLPSDVIDELPLTFYRATHLTPAQKKLLLLQIENRGGENTFIQLAYSYLALVTDHENSGYVGSIPDLALALDVVERKGGRSAMQALESIYLQGRGISDDERVMIRNSYRSMLMRGVGDKKSTGGLMRKAK